MRGREGGREREKERERPSTLGSEAESKAIKNLMQGRGDQPTHPRLILLGCQKTHAQHEHTHTYIHTHTHWDLSPIHYGRQGLSPSLSLFWGVRRGSDEHSPRKTVSGC